MLGKTELKIKGNKEQNLAWEGYGFNVTIPEGAVDKDVTVQLEVKAFFTDRFDLPDDVHLVSALYSVCPSQPFQKEVLLHISHFASIDSEEEASNYAFLVGTSSQESLSYNFKFKDGIFLPHFQQATISMREFSSLGAVHEGPRHPSRLYDFHYYLTHVQPHEWVVSYYVTHQLSSSLKVNVYSFI